MVTRLRYLGVAPEATYAESPAPDATLHVDIASATLDTPSEPDLVYAGGLGRSARTRRPGYYAPEGNIMYAFDIDSIGHFLYWALGGYVFTADQPEVGLNTHEFYGSNESELPSFVARLGKDKLPGGTDFEHVFSGCVIGQIAVAVSDSLAEVTADISASVDARDSIKEIDDLLLPTEFPLAFHEMTASLNGVDRSSIIKSTTLTINNNAAVGDGRSIGSRHPRRVPVNERETTFAMELYWESLFALQQFWGDADGPAAGGQSNIPVVLTFNAGPITPPGTGADRTLAITLGRSWYSAVGQQPSGRTELVQSLAGKSLATSVTLLDGVTEVDTDVYARLINDQPDITA